MSYVSGVASGLDAALDRAVRMEVDLDAVRWVVFSDLHRGRRDRGDDFLRSERAYNAALGYYLEAGFTLLLLGDIEELWSVPPDDIIDAYRYTYELEDRFYEEGRYFRFFGNHDDLWESAGAVRDHLDPVHPGIEVLESLAVDVRVEGRDLGTLLFAHGHQGATFSDRHRELGKAVVGNLWGPFQRRIRQASNTPAHDSALREKHDLALYRWADRQERLVLVSGHTHRPVFMSESESRKVSRELLAARARLAGDPSSADLRRQVALLRARLEWVKAQGRDQPGNGAGAENPRCPCYFNVGCCSFVDGDITGLEIVDRQVRLVRWPGEAGGPVPKVLARADLERDVFGLL